MASVFTRNGVLYIQYMFNGRKIQRSTKLKDTKENRKYIEKEVIPALERKLALGITDDKRLIKYANLYLKEKEHLKTYPQLERIVDVILNYFGANTEIDKIKTSQIRMWLKSFNRKRSTIQNYKTALKGIFDMAIEDEIIDRNPVTAIQIKTNEQKPEITPFSPEEVRALLKNSQGWFRNFLGIAFYTGMRTGEIMGLQINDIQDDYIIVRRSIRNGIISTTKTNKERVVPILEPARIFIMEQLKIAKEKRTLFLFTDENNKHFHSAWQFKAKWKNLLRACKIADSKRMYNTRHTFIVSMLKSNSVSVMELAQIVGHVGPEMIYKNYARYIKGEQLKINRNLDPFADNFADSSNLKRKFNA
ncbi:tyrosine-type recombinase/integrase [Nitrosophilus kaiyonis]|uniref:tyrosine-type recombinase/integrase n=1 Tax=Nitrosophilus kaiyonis TaxID=2930200 RepID=UPI0024910C31|nr:tyrosine-type recombinase/integrase [Nitrosophilus kaiyonis]